MKEVALDQPLEMADPEFLRLQVKAFQDRVLQLQEEKNDLEMILETVTQHSDYLLLEKQQEKQNLELLLETTLEHTDAVQSDFFNQATQAKQQVEEQFKLIAEATPVGLMISRISDGQILYVNAAAGKLVGLTPTQLLDRKTLEFYQQPEDQQKIISVLLKQQSFQGEVACLQANGTSFWALLSLRLFVYHQEATILTAINDITGRKKAEESLQLAEERYRSIFDNALEGIFQATPEGHYLRVNPALAKLYGYEGPATMMASSPTIWAKPWVDPQLQSLYAQQLMETGQVKDFEYQCYRQDNSRFWIAENSRVIRDSQGQILYYEGIVQEITERKRAEEALQRQVKKLQVEIDQAKRSREVKKISQSDYFQNLMAEVDNLRFSEED